MPRRRACSAEGGLSTWTPKVPPSLWGTFPPQNILLHRLTTPHTKVHQNCRVKQSHTSDGLLRCVAGSSRSCASALRFAEWICWLVAFTFLKCMLFTGTFSLTVFCCFPRLRLWQHMRHKCLVVPAAQWDLGGGCRSFELYDARAAVRTIPANNSGNIRAFWSSNGKHLQNPSQGLLSKHSGLVFHISGRWWLGFNPAGS